MTTGYDIIGDVHGCAGKVEGLLRTLGYELQSGAYHHPERQAIFVGDLIDRGPEQVQTLILVRAMVEAGSAQIVMGNHEFNAISYATPNPEIPGEFMRPRNEKNRLQHEAFVEQVQVHPGLYAQTIEWFRTFPLYLDLGDIRVIHACWNDQAIDSARRWMVPGQPMSTEFVIKANQKGTDEHRAIEVLLKGPEVDLRKYGQPDFKIPGDRLRHEARIRWWDAAAEGLRELVEMTPGTVTADEEPYPDLPHLPCSDDETQFDYNGEIPVFYGHYWRRWMPRSGQDWTPNTACVDFSAVRGGPLVAYRWNGASEVSPDDYIRYPDESPHRQHHRVFSRPPIGGTDEELEAWADAFVDTAVSPSDDGMTRPQEGGSPADD